jgi:hypothetical protein
MKNLNMPLRVSAQCATAPFDITNGKLHRKAHTKSTFAKLLYAAFTPSAKPRTPVASGPTLRDPAMVHHVLIVFRRQF